MGEELEGKTGYWYIRIMYFLRETWKTGFSEAEMKTTRAKKGENLE